jgi:2,4-dienoyl-CoA reductase (NADPH2)
MQILHPGRYGQHDLLVAPSTIRAPINKRVPRELSDAEINQTIEDFVSCAQLAQQAGYDGVEIMGSEGYLINQFLAPCTNQRTDQWGGGADNRMRLAIEIVTRTRAAVGANFILMYRISLLDLVENGCLWADTVSLAKRLEQAGVTLFNSGIGWHEARIPTIAHSVPAAAWSWATKRLRSEIDTPIIATNRINTPEQAEAVLANGDADLVSMARPFLADPAFVRKAQANQATAINTCIGCNQACLDQIFRHQLCSCMVNPRACRETELNITLVGKPKNIAVVGGGPAGLACALTAAERGHQVTLYDAADRLGGQFNMAAIIPGKSDYAETIRYFSHQLAQQQVTINLGQAVSAEDLQQQQFDEIVIATGVTPRRPPITGLDHPMVIDYQRLLQTQPELGDRIAIIGAGGIGMDVAEYLTATELADSEADLERFLDYWGVDRELSTRGALKTPVPMPAKRTVYLCQRQPGPPGKGVGLTTVWAHRLTLQKRGVTFLSEIDYQHIDDRGLTLLENGAERLLEVDHVINCSGQESRNELAEQLLARAINCHQIGGARSASKLNAVRAIREGTELAMSF